MDLKQLIADLKAAVEAQRAEIAKFGKASSDSEAKVAKLSQQLDAVQKELDDVKSIASKGLARGNRLGNGQPEVKSLGQRFIDSDQFKAMRQSNVRNSAPMPVGSFRKAALPLTTTGDAADYIQSAGTQRIGAPIARPERQFRLRDIMLTASTSQNAIEYVEETGFYHLHAEVASTAASGQADIVLDNARGFFAGQTVVIAVGTVPVETKIVDSVDYATETITLTTNLANTHAAGVTVTSNKFVFTAETKLKPNASVNFDLLTSTVKTLAHKLPASRQVLADLEGLRAHIDGRLIEGLMLSEEHSILYGDGSNDQLQGIMTHPRTQSYAWSSGPVTDTKLDALRRAMTLAAKANYPVDAVIIGDDDWEDIELQKGIDGHYIWATVVDGGQPRVWRVQVIITNAMEPGDALVGAFGLGITLWDREESSIRIAEQHEDYFAKNMVLILAEERITTTLYRPEAFVKVDLSTPPT